MQNYELLLILPGTLSEDEVDPLVENISKVIEDNDGTNLSVEKIEKRRLAYPIKHIRYGYFNLVYFEAEPEAVVTIQKKLLLNPELLRVLVQKYDPSTQKNRTIKFGLPMQNKDDLVLPRRNNDNRSNTAKPRQEVREVKPVEIKKVEKVEKTEEVVAEVVKPVLPMDVIPAEGGKETTKVEEVSVEEKVKEVKEETPVIVEEVKEKEEEPKEEAEKGKVDLEDIDKKLDDILDIDLSNV